MLSEPNSEEISAVRRWIDTLRPECAGEMDLGNEESALLGDIEACRCILEECHIETQEVLGAGSYGIVFRAMDNILKREVAVKLLRPSVSISSHVRTRFELEAKAMAMCTVEGVVPLYDYRVAHGVPFLVMKCVNGPTLRQFVELQTKSMSEKLIIDIVRQVAKAIQGLHQRGIIHRDLKPSNILLEFAVCASILDDNHVRQMKVLITDFGFVKCVDMEGVAVNQHSNSISVVGTVNYMSPEQAAGRRDQLSTATDIFSLGVILYELLTERCPFSGFGQVGTLQKIVMEDPPSPCRIRKGMSRELEAIVLKCLRKNPIDRYESMMDLERDLGNYLIGEPIMARPISFAIRFYRLAKRNPALTTLFAMVGVGTPLFCIIFATLYTREHAAHQKMREAGDRVVSALQTMEESEAKAREALSTAESSTKLAIEMTRDYLQKLAEEMGNQPGGSEERLRIHLEALGKFEELARVRQHDELSLHQLSIANHYVGAAYSRLGRKQQAIAYYHSALLILDQLVDAFPKNEEYRFDRFYNRLVAGPNSTDIAGWETAIRDIRVLHEQSPGNPVFTDAYAQLEARIASTCFRTYPIEAMEHAMVAITVSKELASRFPSKSHYLKPARAAHCTLGRLNVSRHEGAGVTSNFVEALRLHEQIRATATHEGVVASDEYGMRFEFVECLKEIEEWDQLVLQAEALFPLCESLKIWYPVDDDRPIDVARLHLLASIGYANLGRNFESDQHFHVGLSLRSAMNDVTLTQPSVIEMYEAVLTEATRVYASRNGGNDLPR